MPAAKPIYHNMSKPRRYEPPRHLLASDMVLFHGGDDRAGYGKDPTRTWATVTGAPPSHEVVKGYEAPTTCLLYTSPSPRDGLLSRMPSSA